MSLGWTRGTWTPEFSAVIQRYVNKMRKYGYVTDHEEVAYELGKAVLVLSHFHPLDIIHDPMGLSLVSELSYMPTRRRRVVLRMLRKLYAREIGWFKARKEQDEDR